MLTWKTITKIFCNEVYITNCLSYWHFSFHSILTVIWILSLSSDSIIYKFYSSFQESVSLVLLNITICMFFSQIFKLFHLEFFLCSFTFLNNSITTEQLNYIYELMTIFTAYLIRIITGKPFNWPITNLFHYNYNIANLYLMHLKSPFPVYLICLL